MKGDYMPIHAITKVRSGELSGDLCVVCGGFMVFDKSNRKVKVGSKFTSHRFSDRKKWTIYCLDCGREVLYVPHYKDQSAYR